MSAIVITQVEGTDQIRQLRALIDEYILYLRSLSDHVVDLRQLPTWQNLDDELATLPGIFSPPRGRFFVVLDEHQVVGCVALKPVSETVGELKRMYVKPAYRGQWIGWNLVTTLMDATREIGYTRLILDSHRTMAKAHSIYHGVGFKDIPAPEDAPDFLKQIAIFMAADLSK